MPKQNRSGYVLGSICCKCGKNMQWNKLWIRTHHKGTIHVHRKMWKVLLIMQKNETKIAMVYIIRLHANDTKVSDNDLKTNTTP